MIVLITLSLFSMIAGQEYALPAPVYQAPAPIPVPVYQAPAPIPVPVYHAPAPIPVPVYQAPAPIPVPVYQAPAYPAPPTSPLKEVIPAAVYGVPGENKGGEELQGSHTPSSEGVINLPENTKVDIRDKSGQYSHGFNNEGTQISEQGTLITTNGGWEYVIAKKGSYSYTSPEGQKIAVHYIADHNGYRVIDDPNSS